MKYFAYDLDLDKSVVLKCCPRAKPLSKAILPNFKLVFSGWSRQWKGPVATIIRSSGEKVPGAVYEIKPEEEPRLDRARGYPAASDKIKVMVFPEAGQPLECLTYISRNRARPEKPSPGYLQVLKRAYQDWGLFQS